MFMDLTFVSVALAGTGTQADAIQTRFLTLMAGLGVMGAGAAIIKKGVSQMHEGEHISSKTLSQMGTGAVLIGGGGTLAAWMVGFGMGATPHAVAVSVIGDCLSQLFNPVGPLPVGILYYYYRARHCGTK
jgi:hypothetical protein